MCIKEKCGYIDKTGKEVIPLQYKRPQNYWEGMSSDSNVSAEIYSDGLAPVCLSSGKCGYVNIKNETKVPFKYSDLTSFRNGFAAVKSAGYWGLINKEGKEIIPLKYSSFSLPQEGLISACLPSANGSGDKCGFISTNNKVVIPFKYIAADNFKEGVAKVQDENKHTFFINRQGKVMFQSKYELVLNFSEGYAVACKAFDKCGFIDKKGNRATLAAARNSPQLLWTALTSN